ncbi:hypothetical protein PoB_006604900 [Plakobranchus ocellatus]|uniref:Uncharacterized protein n=1 Tax=Plakobranchus ocellatus TaxID=259542 RepID=A0AAV4D5T9_9GAST|nr:hypothetical protein PoB_006604900 [Plakobranchus ocellatus]
MTPSVLTLAFRATRLNTASLGLRGPQQGDTRLLDPPLGQGAGGGVPIRYRSVPADLMADSLFTVPPKPQETTSSSAKG